MDTPLVSIAIPAYKDKYLHEAISSVLNQTYTNVEVIIVNDCSPNDIDSIVKSFSDPRIRYYVNEANLGKNNPANNWNKCLSYARGEYFSLLCDDDLYDCNFIKTLVLLAQRYPETNVFRCRGCVIDKDKNVIDNYPSSPEWETTVDYMWHVFKNYRYQTISEFMYRTNVVRMVGGYATLPLAWYADYLSVYKFSMTGGIASSSKTMMYFRQSGINISSQDDRNTELKLLASNLYIKETVMVINQLVIDDDYKNRLVNILNYRTKQITKYSLDHAPRKVLFKLIRENKTYGVPLKMFWKAIFKRRK
ncbi:MAG: glycosyltransferase family 2 protein [Muribaculaceae bacterium]|nr:glycosyltransferase family 2 protein [Muribaculaceae bacterium]